MASCEPRIRCIPPVSEKVADSRTCDCGLDHVGAMFNREIPMGRGHVRSRELTPPRTLDSRKERRCPRFQLALCKMPPSGIVLGPPTPEADSWSLPRDTPREEHDDTLDDVAFGIEFKFMIPLLAHGADDPCPDDGRSVDWASLIGPDGLPRSSGNLQREAFLAVAETVRSVAGQRAISISDIDAEGRKETDFWKDHWIVKKSNSAEAGGGMRTCEYLWFAIEISSPKMQGFGSGSISAVREVVDALNSGYRLTTNHTCELHVHLGRLDGRPFTLRTLKKLGTLCWISEPILRSVKNPRSPNFDHVYTWASPLREHSRLAFRQNEAYLTSNGMESPPSSLHADHSRALDLIWTAQDTCALGQLLSGEGRQYRRLGFNFSAFGGEDERAKRSPRSVEVRFLEGCGTSREGVDQICGWIEVCTALARMVVDEPDEDFEILIRDLIADEAKDVDGRMKDSDRVVRFTGFLRKLRVGEEVVSVYRNLIGRIWGNETG